MQRDAIPVLIVESVIEIAAAMRLGFASLKTGLGLGWNRAVGLIYPPSCAGCGSATAEPHLFCSACWAGMRLIERPFCERLGTPFALDLGVGPLLSPRAIAEPPVFARARAATLYDGTAREIVHRMKYGDRLDLARAMARMMTQAGLELIAEADLVVPVPLHRIRLWRRRFNQSAVLAREIGRLSGLPHDFHALARVKPTRPQVGLSRAQRAANLQGAFKVSLSGKSRLSARRILLIDDVLTTGATANAASRVLLRAGAASVDLLTFATVSDETAAPGLGAVNRRPERP